MSCFSFHGFLPEEVSLVEPGVPATPRDVAVQQVLACLCLPLVLCMEDALVVETGKSVVVISNTINQYHLVSEHL